MNLSVLMMRGGRSNHHGKDHRHQNNRHGRGFTKPGDNERPHGKETKKKITKIKKPVKEVNLSIFYLVRRHTLGPITLDFEGFEVKVIDQKDISNT